MKKKKYILCLSVVCICIFSCFIAQRIWDCLPTSSPINQIQAQEKKTIVLDAGHGGYDSGSISSDGIYEKEITLAIALKTGALLEASGIEVIYTRTSDEVSWSTVTSQDLAARVQIGEDQKATTFVSIHTNSSENYDDGAFGYEIYLDSENKKMNALATSIENNLSDLGYSQDRGLKSTNETSLYVIDSNPIDALLIEVGFLSDSEDATFMISEDGQNQIAQSIASGIQENL